PLAVNKFHAEHCLYKNLVSPARHRRYFLVQGRETGMLRHVITATVLLGAMLCASTATVWAQQSDMPKSGQAYEAAVAKAQADCAALWADHQFDPLRNKVPLDESEPTPAMLANSERLSAEDKPIATLAIKTVGQCRKAWEPAWAMRSPAVNLMIEGVWRKQD